MRLLINRFKLLLASLLVIPLLISVSFVPVFAQYEHEGDACTLTQQGQPIPGGTTICNNPNGCDSCPSGYKCGSPNASGQGSCFSTASGDAGVTGRRIQQSYQDWSWYQQSLQDVRDDAYNGSEENTNPTRLNWHFLGSTAVFFGDSIIGTPPEYRAGAENRGAVAQLAQGINAMTTQQPAKTAMYLADLGQQAGIYNPVYAQDGAGFSALRPILTIWKAFRNIAYLAFVIIFVVIGFMIMFRSKVSQQTVISIQLALPQIIVTLLLITFSYAIASLVIDSIYLLIYLIIAIFETFGVLQKGSQGSVQDIIFGHNVIGIAIRNLITPNDAAGAAAKAVTNAVTGIIEGGVGAVVGFGTNVIMYLIFAVAILISVFKLFFQLLISYVGLIFSTIFAPILLLFNAMPGSQSFSKWLKGIIANALVFPVAAMMLLVAAALIGEGDFKIAANVGYNAHKNQFDKIALPLVGGGMDTNAIMGIIGIGFLMMMPKLIELVQKALGVEGGIGGMMGAIMEPIQTAWNMGPQKGYNLYQQGKHEAAQIERDKYIHGYVPSTYKGPTRHIAGKILGGLFNPLSKS